MMVRRGVFSLHMRGKKECGVVCTSGDIIETLSRYALGVIARSRI